MDSSGDIYLKQLKTAAKYVHSFEMLNKGNSTDYFLFFATNSLKELEKMKDAMWKVDDTGSFQFSDHVDALGLGTSEELPDPQRMQVMWSEGEDRACGR